MKLKYINIFYLVILYGFKNITDQFGYWVLHVVHLQLIVLVALEFIDLSGYHRVVIIEVHWGYLWIPFKICLNNSLKLSYFHPFSVVMATGYICLNNSLKLSYFHLFAVVMATGYRAAILKHHEKIRNKMKNNTCRKKIESCF